MKLRIQKYISHDAKVESWAIVSLNGRVIPFMSWERCVGLINRYEPSAFSKVWSEWRDAVRVSQA